MKLKYIYNVAALSALLLSACTQDDELTQEDIAAPEALSIQRISVADFTTGSRASNDGVTVTFENGDRIGLMLIDADGNATGNVPFEYTDGVWNNVENASYSSKIQKAVAYFPYIENLNPTTSAEELKDSYNWISAEEFKDKDLLVSEINVTAPELTVGFKHAFSLISLSAEGSVTAGEETYTYPLDLSDVSFSIGDEQYTPEIINGKFLCLIDGKELRTNDFRYFYTIGGTTYAKTLNETVTLESNHSYTFPCPTSDSEETSVAPGDFYCISENGVIVIIPDNAASIPEGLTCKGIVFYVMTNEDFSSFAITNGLTAGNYPGFNGNHGLVVSLKDGGSLGTAESFEKFLLSNIDGWNDKTRLNGYKITQAMQEAVTKNTITSFTALNGHEETTSPSATSWFAPSFMELAILVRGSDGNTVSANGKTYIDKQLQKLEGTAIAEGNIPSITFESQETPQEQNVVWFITGNSGTEFSYPFTDTTPGETYRPICAF